MKNEPGKNESNNKKKISKQVNIMENILTTNNIKRELNEKSPKKEKKSKKEKRSKKEKKLRKNLKSIDEEDYKKVGDFSYIQISKNIIPFIFNSKNKNFSFIDKEIIFKVIFLISIDDDSLKSSNDLYKIFQYVFLSLNNLNNIGITNSQILICLLFNHFSYEKTRQKLFPNINFYEFNYNNKQLSLNKFYCSLGKIYPNNKPLIILNFYKENSSFAESHKFFYSEVMNELLEGNHLNISENTSKENLIIINWTNGKFIIDNEENNKFTNDYGILSNIINYCSNNNILLNFDVNFISDGVFGQVIKYNLDRDKIINYLYWNSICSYPVDYRFYCISMNNKFYEKIKNYYKNLANKYSTQILFGYNLSISLDINLGSDEFTIQKINSIKIGYRSTYSSFTDLYYNYIDMKGSGFCGDIYLIAVINNCKKITCWKLFQKILVLINSLIIFLKFLWFGLMLVVFYSVINDGLGEILIEKHYGYVFVFFYGMVITIFLFININTAKNNSRINNNIIKRNESRNKNIYLSLVILYFLHYIYAVFFIVCCILTIIHIKDDTSKGIYYILVFLNIFLYILPYFLSFSNIFSKGFFFHLFIQLPNNFSFFYFPYIITCNKNRYLVKSNKKFDNIYIFTYFAVNGLLTYGCLIFDDQRKIRVDFFFILLMILCIINGFRDIWIIIGFIKECSFNKNFDTYSKNNTINNYSNSNTNLINKNECTDKILFLNNENKEDDKKENSFNNEESNKYSLTLSKEDKKKENNNEGNNRYLMSRSCHERKLISSFDSVAEESNQLNAAENISKSIQIIESNKLDKIDDNSNKNNVSKYTNINLKKNEKINDQNLNECIKNNDNKKIIDIYDLNQYYNEQYLESKKIWESISQNQDNVSSKNYYPNDTEEYPHDTIIK